MRRHFLLAAALAAAGSSAFAAPLSAVLKGASAEDLERVRAGATAIREAKGAADLRLAPTGLEGERARKAATDRPASLLVETAYLLPGASLSGPGRLAAYNALSQIRSLSGVTYYSESRGKVTTLLSEVYRVPRDGSREAQPDPTADEVPERSTFALHMRDSNFGSSWYRVEFEGEGEGLSLAITNTRALGILVVRAFEPEGFRIRFALAQTDEGILVYGICAANPSKTSASMVDMWSAVEKRLNAIRGWIAGKLGELGVRILIISYYFPPFMNVGGFRAISWARRFHDAGHDVTVVKGEGREAASCAYFEEELGREIRTLSVRNPLLAEESGAREQPRPSRLEGLKDALRRHVPVLDSYVAWARAAAAAALAEEAARGPFDAIISTSFPLSAHEAAWRIKARRDIVWVADFRDYYGQFGSNAIDRCSGRGRFLARRVAAYGRAMDLATTVSERLRTLLADWLPGTPFMTLYNGYFKEHLPASMSAGPEWTILYTGSYNAREFTLAPLAEALAALKARGVAPPELVFTGERDEAIARAFEPAGIVPRFLGAVSNREALELQQKAGFLLVCDAMSGPGALLTKTFEYLAAKRPVIAITREGSDLRESVFADPAPGYVATTEAKAIAAFIVAWKDRGLGAVDASFYAEERIEFFSRERQADMLLERIEALVAERRRA